MKTPLEKIKFAVEQTKDLPNAIIEYNFDELPKVGGIEPDSFFGIKAYPNKSISKIKGCNVIYKLS